MGFGCFYLHSINQKKNIAKQNEASNRRKSNSTEYEATKYLKKQT